MVSKTAWLSRALARDSEPIRLLEIPASPSLNMLIDNASWEVDNETMAGVNSCFAEVTENDILRMQNITTLNDSKKATKLGMDVLRNKHCFDTQLAHMSSVFCPDRQALLMHLSLNNNCPSTAPFQSPIHVWVLLSVSLKMIVISNISTASTWQSFHRKLHNLFFSFQVNCNCFHGTTSRY